MSNFWENQQIIQSEDIEIDNGIAYIKPESDTMRRLIKQYGFPKLMLTSRLTLEEAGKQLLSRYLSEKNKIAFYNKNKEKIEELVLELKSLPQDDWKDSNKMADFLYMTFQPSKIVLNALESVYKAGMINKDVLNSTYSKFMKKVRDNQQNSMGVIRYFYTAYPTLPMFQRVNRIFLAKELLRLFPKTEREEITRALKEVSKRGILSNADGVIKVYEEQEYWQAILKMKNPDRISQTMFQYVVYEGYSYRMMKADLLTFLPETSKVKQIEDTIYEYLSSDLLENYQNSKKANTDFVSQLLMSYSDFDFHQIYQKLQEKLSSEDVDWKELERRLLKQKEQVEILLQNASKKGEPAEKIYAQLKRESPMIDALAILNSMQARDCRLPYRDLYKMLYEQNASIYHYVVDFISSNLKIGLRVSEIVRMFKFLPSMLFLRVLGEAQKDGITNIPYSAFYEKIKKRKI